MPIEFPCDSCGNWLRTPDDSAGKQAKCPSCQHQMVIPAMPPATVEPSTPLPAPGSEGRPSPPPIRSGDVPNPFVKPDNPYQTPSDAPSPLIASSEARSKVRGPAIGLLVTAALCLLMQILNIVSVLVQGFDEGLADLNDPAERVGFFIGMGLMLIIPTIIYPLMIFGAIQMMQLKSYSLSISTCIFSFLPCSICCFLCLPFGIWGLVVLMDVNVKPHFLATTHHAAASQHDLM